MKHPPLLPGATVGILGGGQLGRMLCAAARPMGLRTMVYCDEPDGPAQATADSHVTGSYLDQDRVRKFAGACDVITFEFENVPSQTARWCAETTVVRPDPELLETASHRLREKEWLQARGFPVGAFQRVQEPGQLPDAVATIGLPAILKTVTSGYDGKGQVALATEDDLNSIDSNLFPAILEARIPFEKELSVIVGRTSNGQAAVYPVFENQHHNHILDVTICPANIPDPLADTVRQLAFDFAEQVGLVGLATLELFLVGDGILINEIAPRVHNSGHLTLEATVTSQFAQQLRCVCGWHPGSTELLRPAAMANLLGDLWGTSAPDWSSLTESPDLHLHLYGKRSARPGRKMGHLTVLAADTATAAERVRRARQALDHST